MQHSRVSASFKQGITIESSNIQCTTVSQRDFCASSVISVVANDIPCCTSAKALHSGFNFKHIRALASRRSTSQCLCYRLTTYRVRISRKFVLDSVERDLIKRPLSRPATSNARSARSNYVELPLCAIANNWSRDSAR